MGTAIEQLLTPPEAAKVVEPESLRKCLERWRHSTFQGWSEVTNRGLHEPKYLYSPSDVMPIIRELQTSVERPSKKNS